MGYGDEIMVTGEVKLRAAGTARRFAIRDSREISIRRGQQHRWHEVWEGNPRIAAPGESFDEWYPNGPGMRPYIKAKSPIRWTWNRYSPKPGEIFFLPRERPLFNLARGRIIIQPDVKSGASPNKQWGLRNWERLVALHPALPWLQIGDGHEARIPGVEFLPTRSFRDAMAVLSGARAAVLHEGGLHHAAAALSVPAVVIFGGFISPEVTGYAKQKSLFVEDRAFPLGCGARTPCVHCSKAMGQIGIALVLKTLKEII